MANLSDYLAWRGDLPFAVDGFNEVDIIVDAVRRAIRFLRFL